MPRRCGARLGDTVPHTVATTTAELARSLVRSGRVDLVHVHMTAAEVAGVVAAPRHRGSLVSTRHFSGPRGASALGRAFAPLISRALALQLSVSQAVADSIGEPSTVLHGAVPSRHEPVGPRRPTVMVLQRLEREKETELALRAWSRARARQRGWTLEVAGDGSLRSELEALAASLGISDTVVFLGQVDDARERLGSAGMLVAPGRVDSFGLSVVEAMAAATPVVAARGGGHRETVGTCAGAQLFDPGDFDGCAAQIDGLVDDGDGRAAHGAALQQHQRARFDIEDHTDKLLGVYERLL